MMRQSVEGAKIASEKLGKKQPIILGVTMLTSISQEVLNDELEINKNVSNYVIHLAKLAKEAGLTGVVASPLEVENIKNACGKDFKVLCPGIRPKWSEKNDQKRIATPYDTVKKGADYLVIGRAVTSNENPVEAMKKIYDELREI